MKPFTTALVFSIIIAFLGGLTIRLVVFAKDKPAKKQSAYKIVKVDRDGYREDEIRPEDSLLSNNDSDSSQEIFGAKPKPGEVVKKYNWTYQDKNYVLEAYINKDLQQIYGDSVSGASEEIFYRQIAQIDKADESIKRLAVYFNGLAKIEGWSSEQKVEAIISWLQQIKYVTLEGPPKRPFKTLLDGYGDCDDKSLVGYCLLRELGYGVGLISFPMHVADKDTVFGHMAIAINTQSGPFFDNTNMCYLEVSGQYPIGEEPDKQKGENFQIILRTTGKSYNPTTINALTQKS